VSLIFDEVSLVGELTSKVVKGEYKYIGMRDELSQWELFGAPRSATSDEAPAALRSALATHALVFQVAELGDSGKPRFRRVVGIHAVGSLVAEQLFKLFWETVANLEEFCGLQVVCSICDGAGCNRLFQKMCVLPAAARGMPNRFEPKRSAWCHNPWASDPNAKIFLMSKCHTRVALGGVTYEHHALPKLLAADIEQAREQTQKYLPTG
jgi:hypothetical protein